MNKHYMITVSEDQSAMHGLRFVGHFVDDPSSVEVTLFYTALGEGFQRQIMSHAERAELEARKKKREDAGEEAMDKAKETLVKTFGFKEGHVHTKLKFRHSPKAVDILNEGEEGMYDAIVLGRRGLSRLEELVDDSVSREILSMKMSVPVWICRSINEKKSDLLLCVDDSGPSGRIADHVGYVLSGDTRHKVVIYHVWDPDSGKEGAAYDLVHSYRKVLVDNGVAESRITTHVVPGNNYCSMILDRVQEQDFAAVAVGRTGPKGTVFQRLFMGAVSTRLLRDLEGTALWVCH